MAILQSKESELRYLKRKNLEQESRTIGNYYRDIIRSYGIDCVYHKLDTSFFDSFKTIVDKNTIIEKAYGINIQPDYSISACMLTYPEVEQDIFQLNKYGLTNNEDINFYFDSIDFACSLATKCGQYKEFKIKETEFFCEVPEITDKIKIVKDIDTGEFITSSYVSSEIFPYRLGLGMCETFQTIEGGLSGKISAEIYSYEFDKETTILAHVYEHSDFELKFPVNEYLAKSFYHKIKNDDYLQNIVYITYKVSKVPYGKNKKGETIYKCVLHGKLHGGVLFYSLEKISKYLTKIHPEVGDLLKIDFPNDENGEMYEITTCYDKSLQSDGISPLLHTYVWKCKAKRYVRNNDNIPNNEADDRLDEKKRYEQVVEEHVADKISKYDYIDEENNITEDDVYGGYENKDADYDSKRIDPTKHYSLEYVKDGTEMLIHQFDIGSSLTTTGYELIFNTKDDQSYIIAVTDHKLVVKDALFESGLRFLKATDDTVVFVNIEGQSNILAKSNVADVENLEICLNDLYSKTLDSGIINNSNDNFIKFKGSRTFMWATADHLFVKLANEKDLYCLC